jgi:hypothetical protein
LKPEVKLHEVLEPFNRSELSAIAVANEIPGFPKVGAPRYLPREELIEILIAMRPVPNIDPMQDIRVKINRFMTRYWDRVKCQVKLPQCPECVLGRLLPGDQLVRCSEVKVAICYLENKKRIDV